MKLSNIYHKFQIKMNAIGIGSDEQEKSRQSEYIAIIIWHKISTGIRGGKTPISSQQETPYLFRKTFLHIHVDIYICSDQCKFLHSDIQIYKLLKYSKFEI